MGVGVRCWADWDVSWVWRQSGMDLSVGAEWDGSWVWGQEERDRLG